MNCNCGIPVTTRTVRKEGPNQGKTYQCCARNTCRYYVWLGNGTLPPVIQPDYGRASDVNPQSTATSTKIPVSTHLHQIDTSPCRIWFRIQYPKNDRVDKCITDIPADMKLYDESKKLWSIDFRMYEELIPRLQSSEFSSLVQLNELPLFVVRGLRNFLISMENSGDEEISIDIRPTFLDQLKNFQREGVRFVIRRKGRALIGDEMGCGKTVQAIAVMEHYKHHWPALVLLPPTLISQWREELLRFCSGLLEEKDICCVRKMSDAVNGKVCLVPYSRLPGLTTAKKLKPEQFGVVICDESHLLKSKDAKRSNLAIPFLKKATVALCLSGTPATNRPVELYTQLNGLLPKVFNDYDGFTRRYCNAKASHFSKAMDVRGSSNEAELKLILEGLVMIRRLKSQVAHELPDKRRETRYIVPDPCYLPEIKRLRKAADQFSEQLRDPRNDADALKRINNAQQVNMVAQYEVCGLAKIPGVIEEIKSLLTAAKLIRSRHDRIPHIPSHNCQKNISRSMDANIVDLTIDENFRSLPVISTIEKDSVGLCEDVFEVSSINEGHPNKDDRNSMLASLDISEDEDDVLFSEPKILKRRQQNAPSRRSKASKRQRIRKLLESSDDDDSTNEIEESESEKDEAAAAWRRILRGCATKHVENGEAATKNPCSNKIIVFAHHKKVMDALEDCLRDCGVVYIRVDGDATQSKRDTLIRQFQNDSDTDIALLSVTACGTGLNLTSASIAVFAELSWSHGSILQAEDRIHR